jgi:hypothetical protein
MPFRRTMTLLPMWHSSVYQQSPAFWRGTRFSIKHLPDWEKHLPFERNNGPSMFRYWITVTIWCTYYFTISYWNYTVKITNQNIFFRGWWRLMLLWTTTSISLSMKRDSTWPKLGAVGGTSSANGDNPSAWTMWGKHLHVLYYLWRRCGRT